MVHSASGRPSADNLGGTKEKGGTADEARPIDMSNGRKKVSFRRGDRLCGGDQGRAGEAVAFTQTGEGPPSEVDEGGATKRWKIPTMCFRSKWSWHSVRGEESSYIRSKTAIKFGEYSRVELPTHEQKKNPQKSFGESTGIVIIAAGS